MRAVVKAYQYDGAHRHYHRASGRFIAGYEHWDWRYRIVTDNGMTVLYRQGFCTYEAALLSLRRKWSQVEDAVQSEGVGRVR